MKEIRLFAIVLTAFCSVAFARTEIFLPKTEPAPETKSIKLIKPVLKGTASWYRRSHRRRLRTASGELFDDTKMTCAAWNYKFGTRLKITDLKSGRSVVCRVNDRGPARRLHRAVDLSKSAFKEIANPKIGLARVEIVPLDQKVPWEN